MKGTALFGLSILVCSCGRPLAPPVTSTGTVVSVGMEFSQAKANLTAHGAKPVTMSMMYTSEFETYELADGSVLCITTRRPLETKHLNPIRSLTICTNMSVLNPMDRVYHDVQKVEVMTGDSQP